MGDYPYQTLPRCLFCGYPNTEDVTPNDARTEEHVFECPQCHRTFAVRFIPPSESSD